MTTPIKRHFALWLVFAGLLTALLAGCGGGDRAGVLPGTWETREGSATLDAPAAIGNADGPAGVASAMATLSHTQLDLKDDKTFALSGTTTASGSWTFDKETGAITLSPTGGGAPLAAKLSDANQQISLPNPTGQGKEIVLQKKDS